MTLNISEQTKRNHDVMSRTSAKFIEFIKNNPEVLKFENFPVITTFDDGEKGRLNPWPIWLGPAMRAQINEAASGIVTLLKQVPRRVFNNDYTAISSYFELPPEKMPLAMAGWKQQDMDNLLGRGDFVLSSSGFKCIEFNLAANLGGILLSTSRPLYQKNPVLAKFIRENDVNFSPYQHTAVQLFRHLVDDALARCNDVQEDGEVNIAILIGERPPWKPVRPHETFLLNSLRELLNTTHRHIRVNVFFTNSDFELKNNKAYHRGKRIHSAVTVFFSLSPHFQSVFEAGNILLYNGGISMVLCQKLLLSALSENKDSGIFNAEERRIIETYLPWTRKLRHTRTKYHDEEIDLIDFVRNNKEKLVLKPSVGLGGDDVFVGYSTPQDQWNQLVDQAIEKRIWLAQEFHKPVTHLYQAGENGCGEFRSIWGFFTFGNRYIDGFLRVIPEKIFSGVINCKLGATVGMFLEVED